MNSRNFLTQTQEIKSLVRILGITQKQIAQAINADQSQVSRVLSGKAKKASKVFNEVCEYVNSMHMKANLSSPILNEELMSAVASVWDGTDHHASALAVVIRSLGAFRSIHDKEQQE